MSQPKLLINTHIDRLLVTPFKAQFEANHDPEHESQEFDLACKTH